MSATDYFKIASDRLSLFADRVAAGVKRARICVIPKDRYCRLWAIKEGYFK
jgi:hypothetical protein